ncbi:MAG: DUF503 domain-containing protein [Actinomycetota bacterium]|nr:DUF503 domain-containing protein [Actinomycetota bacterium]
MHVGALRIELRIRDMRSLKEKRKVVKSIIADIGRVYPVAVAEVDHQDLWQRADLGVAVVSGSPGHVDRMLAAIQIDLDCRTEIEILGVTRSYLEEEDR